MRFLADENVPARSVDLLRLEGLDILHILSKGAGLTDREVLDEAESQRRILITFDRDFGELVSRRGAKAKGIILLRFAPKSPEQVAQKIKALVESGIPLEGQFVVLEKERVRLTRIPDKPGTRISTE